MLVNFYRELNVNHASSIPSLLTDLLCQSQPLRVGDGRQLLFLQLLNSVLLIPQIELGPNQDDGCGGAVVANFGEPLMKNRMMLK